MSVMYEVAVIGLGAAGSAALNALAVAGARAAGVDRFAPPHDQGSSHGETRLLRTAYAEGTLYVPMARRAIELWRALEARTGNVIFRQTGVVYAAPQSSPFLSRSLASARAHDVRVDDLGRGEARLEIPDDWQCCVEREGGYVLAERAITAFLADAQAHGAELRLNEVCRAIEPDGDGVRIVTNSGEVRAQTCIVAGGAWATELMPAVAAHLHVERKTLHWFADPEHRYTPGAFRPFLIDDPDGHQVYGFPDCGTGLKFAEHTAPSAAHARVADVAREITIADTESIDAFAHRYCPALGALTRSVTCLYPMSKDGHFIIDRLPDNDRIVFAAGLSGHGFKFAPVIGEALADFALGRAPRIDLKPFALSRFG